MTNDPRLQLHAALSAIASLDGDRARQTNQQGFSKVDGDLGHALVEQDPLGWTLRQTYAAYKIAARYKNTQLPLLGIDFSAIPEPAEPGASRPVHDRGRWTTTLNPDGIGIPAVTYPPSTIRLIDNRFEIAFPYGEPDFYPKKDAVKNIIGRRWENERKVWSLPFTPDAIAGIVSLITDYATAASPFEIDDAAVAAIDVATERFTENVKASHAADADYEPGGLNPAMTLLPFQRAGVSYMVTNKHVILGDDMGLGKTPQAIAAVTDQAAWPLLVVCPSSLKLNWKREIERWVDPAIGTYGMFRPGNDGRSHLIIQVAEGTKLTGLVEPIDVLIINYDILDAWKDVIQSVAWGCVIADEAHYCFPYEALVETDRGPLPIGEIVENRLPVSVLSYDSSGNALEWKPVTNWWRNQRNGRWVRVEHDRGSFICTEHHRIWTDRGYIEAVSLTSDDYVRVVPSGVLGTEGGDRLAQSSVLRSLVCSEVAHVTAGAIRSDTADARGGDGSDTWLLTTGRIGTDASKQSDERSGYARENAPVALRSHVSGTRRERDDHEATTGDRDGTRSADGVRDSHGCGSRSVSELAVVVQGGRGSAGRQDSDRGRWQDTPNEAVEVLGCPENGRPERTRVVGVAILERGSGHESRWSLGDDQAVYDLEVADHHNYVCEGVVVSNCKSHKAIRTKAMKAILKVTQPDYLFLLTGTPFLSRPIEGWTLIEMIGHSQTFGGWGGYTSRYCDKKQTRFGIDVSGASNLGELNTNLRSNGAYVRRKKADVLKELPPRRWATVPVEMTAAGAKQYLKAEDGIADFLADQRSQDAERMTAWRAESLMALQATKQTDAIPAPISEWVDAYVDAKRREYRSTESARLSQTEQLVRFEALKQLAYEGKRKAVMDWIANFLESGEKLVVFANHREVVNEIAGACNAPKIMGGMSAAEVEAGKTQFQTDPDCKVIVCNIKAGGVGHTLTAASNVCMVEFGWTPAEMDQAADRTHRIGQTKPVTIWQLVAARPDGLPSIDDEIVEVIASKRAVTEAATDGGGEMIQISVLAELRNRLQKRGDHGNKS